MDYAKRKIAAFIILCALIISTHQPIYAATTYTTGTYKVTASSLNVRSGPGTDYSSLGTAKSGSTYTVTEIRNTKWGKISFNGKTGWISLAYCTKTSSTTSSGTTTGSSSTGEMSSGGTNYKVTASTLNVRSGPGSGYSKLGALSSGAIVTVTSITNNWGKIDYKGKAGWISLSYCTKQSSTAATGSTTGTSQTTGSGGTSTGTGTKYRITVSSLNVRSGPGTGYSKLGSVTSGTIVTVLSTSNNWGKINYNSKTGWISLNTNYVTKLSESTSSGNKKPNGFATGSVIKTDGEASYQTTGLRLAAHRGSGGEDMENTLAGYKKAGEEGFWGIEGDVRAYSSTTLLMGHDFVNASSCTYSDYLDVCKKYGCVAIIDLKSGLSTANLKKAIDLVKEKGLIDQAVFQTGNTTYLSTIRSYAPDAHVWYLAMTVTQMENALTIASQYNIEGIDVFKDLEDVSAYIGKYKAAGLKVSCNTFEDEEELKRFVEYGCDYPMYDKQ